ncbi:tRNA (cytidine(56)-2'-O)-methyltransferase [Candidatus Bathyarchaeota archaeon]|nr:tRNA (cytidine(56)-2'-O)-methyltransferase [Candidatus Bathyarchaeota archaeon]
MVLRWGHRPRDERLTTHVALTARAFNASGMILADVEDRQIKKTIEDVVSKWGGSFFFQMGAPWKTVVQNWKAKGGIVVHLTAYGENIQSSTVLQRIREMDKDMLIIVGSRKVPGEFFSSDISDFNVAVGNQPHSECSSLAVFLDRFYQGKGLVKGFQDAELRIVPQKHGKKMLS